MVYYTRFRNARKLVFNARRLGSAPNLRNHRTASTTICVHSGNTSGVHNHRHTESFFSLIYYVTIMVEVIFNHANQFSHDMVINCNLQYLHSSSHPQVNLGHSHFLHQCIFILLPSNRFQVECKTSDVSTEHLPTFRQSSLIQ